jgi:glucose/arabinose dehydrogenase
MAIMLRSSLRKSAPVSARAQLRITRLEDRTVPASLVPGFAEQSVATGLSSPTAMEFSPDNKLFICEKAGTMEVWENGARLQPNFFLNTPISTQTLSERGLLSVTFDPSYASNRFVYVYYTTTAADNHNRVSRFTANAAGDLALAGTEFVIVDLDAHSAGNHNGGAIHFGPDGKLYVACGDNANGNNAQSLTSRHGKILRYNSDGTIPSNPTSFPGITGSTAGVYQAIWAVGLRNPYTFTFQPGTGRMHINDVGEVSWEEINIGTAGVNYGWPGTEGLFNQGTFPNFTLPLYAYPHSGGTVTGQAITGGAFYNPSVVQFPTSYTGDYFFADYVAGWIKSIDLNTLAVTGLATSANGPVDLRVRPDGSLYYLSINGGVAMRVYSAPRVTGTVINSGAAQRSRVTDIALSFNAQVAFPNGIGNAFTLTRNGGGAVGFTPTASVVNGVTVVTLTNFTGAETESGSLRDGRFTLTGIANQILNGTLTLDGNGDGVGTAGDNFTYGSAQGLFRFFGDANADQNVDIADFGLLSSTFNLNSSQTGFLGYFDWNNDGAIDIADFGQFSARIFTTLP